MRTITVGRDNSCDIVINDPRVSRVHANIIQQAGAYIFRDMSTNGTLINGTMLKRSDINVKFGDSVLLDSSVALPWHKVQAILPLYDENSYIRAVQNDNIFKSYSKDAPGNISDWSWGGFFFGWLWAICNGIYWPLIIFIPIVGWVAAIVINIMLGINGNRWAWEKKHWHSIEHFERVQKQWAQAALWFFLISIIVGVFWGIMIAASI